MDIKSIIGTTCACFVAVSFNVNAVTVRLVDNQAQGYAYSEVFDWSGSHPSSRTVTDSAAFPDTSMSAWSYAGCCGTSNPSVDSTSSANVVASDNNISVSPTSSQGVGGLLLRDSLVSTARNSSSGQSYTFASQLTVSHSVEFELLVPTIDWNYKTYENVVSGTSSSFEVSVENTTSSLNLLLTTGPTSQVNTTLSGAVGDIIRITTTGSLDYLGGEYPNYSRSSMYMEMSFGDYSVTPPPPVPIPSAVWLFGSGLLGLIGVARRK